ncbi:hypothetical protein FHX48_002176 [Microbacterium halimionae]|uniref:Uncharacterized protein n=1 Tax=Microbacterium halimionae TaxID=1526413 RepID=A0A7W3JQC4_9MICO|nr:hypothetical protein [Microbacterium halimionae]MBA8817082.1 hypothetical protein [Microbacterium halimionae]NII94378.1 hypothetical protein [Microbacterium halimionae]
MNVRRQLEAAPVATSTATTPKVDRSAIVDASVHEALDIMQRAEENRSKTTGSPVPPQVDPARPRTTTKPGADHGPER